MGKSDERITIDSVNASNESGELLLNRQDKLESTPHLIVRQQQHRHVVFKIYVIVSMCCVWTAYTLLVKYTRNTGGNNGSASYSASTVVFLSELVKLTSSMLLLFVIDSQFHPRKFRLILMDDVFGRPAELMKMSVPSVVYALQNNLDFVALSRLDAAVYQVTNQLKIFTTVVFMVVILRRRYSCTRYSAISLLAAGIALVQLDAVSLRSATATTVSTVGENSNNLSKDDILAVNPNADFQNYIIGISAVVACSICSGFAGVYFEAMLKDGVSSLWVRNIQMYLCGAVAAGAGCLFSDGNEINEFGFFHGYNTYVFLVVGLLSIGGIYISLVMKYLDNLLKSFASAVSIILVAVLSVYLFASPIGTMFVIGSATVCLSIVLYSSVSE